MVAVVALGVIKMVVVNATAWYCKGVIAARIKIGWQSQG